MNLLGAIIAACRAYVAWVEWQRLTYQDRIEDEIDRLSDRGDPADKLRIEILKRRLERQRAL